MKLFNSLYIAKIYAIEGHAIYMKCYDGSSLRSQIDKGGADRGRFYIAWQICTGLKEIHRINYVHSDLKASNILVGKYIDGKLSCFISDFGVSRERGTWPIACTKGFRPANFFKKPLCFEDDIFSLGKLFLELFGKFKDYEMWKINYDNFQYLVSKEIFSDNYNEESENNITTNILLENDASFKFYDLVHEMINEDSSKRPSLDKILTLLDIINY